MLPTDTPTPTNPVLDNALRLHPVVWVVGEPLRAAHEVRESLARQETPAVATFWNPGSGDTGTAVFGMEPKEGRAIVMELMRKLLTGDNAVFFMDGMTLDAGIQAGAMSAVDRDARLIFVASNPPPDTFLTDYLEVVTLDHDDITADLQTTCEVNRQTWDNDYLAPLGGLRPYRATSLLRTSFLAHPDENEEWGDRLASILEGRKAAIERDSGGVIKMLTPSFNYDDVVGAETIKHILRALAESVAANEPVRGCMLFGIPGTGKTMIAEGTAGQYGLPYYILDMGSMFGSKVGETEAKSRRAVEVLKKSPPGIVLLDEMEKGLSGTSAGTEKSDSGVGRRMGAVVLDYLNRPVAGGGGYHLPMGTCNDISSLPSEYTRAGRWDVIAFFDLPPEEVSVQVLAKYRALEGLPKTFGAKANLEDMTQAEIEATCRIATRLLKVQPSVTWEDALQYVPRLAVFRREEVEFARQWANGRAISANAPKVVAPAAKNAKKSGGSIKNRR